MIIYKNVLEKLKDAGYNTTRIRNEKLLSESTLTCIRNNGVLTTRNIEAICNLLHCQPNDIILILPDIHGHRN